MLSKIVGIISLQGVTIIKAQSVCASYNDNEYFKDIFDVEIDSVKNESWYIDIPNLITKLFNTKNHPQKTNSIKQIEYLMSCLPQKASEFPIFDIYTQKNRG